MRTFQRLMIVLVFVVMVAGTANSQTTSTTKPKSKNGCKLTYVGVEVLPFTNLGTSKAELTPEYGWRCQSKVGTFTGFGFVEMRNNQPWFTNHNVHWTPPVKKLSFLAIGTEQGGTPANGKRSAFIQAGAKIQTTKLPVVGPMVSNAFKSLAIGHYSRVAGTRTRNETLIAWTTKSLKIGEAQIYSEGFYRIRAGNRINVGQPQVWIRLKKDGLLSKVAFGAEFEVVGKKVTTLFGTKIYLR